MTPEEKRDDMQPKFKNGKTYDGRRGRRTYTIKGNVSTPAHGGRAYDYFVNVETNGEVVERRYTQEQLLDIARLNKKDGDKVWLSPSQIKTFNRCKKQWAYTYIDGETTPSNKSQAFGTEMHSAIEHYLRTGEWHDDEHEGPCKFKRLHDRRDAMECGMQGLHVLPDPKGPIELLIEEPINLSILDGAAVIIGYVDLLYKEDDGTVVVRDHKSTKDLRYAIAEEALGGDVQAVIYATAAMERFKTNQVDLRWGYHCARPSRAKAADADGRPRNLRGFKDVTSRILHDDVFDLWGDILDSSLEMVTLSTDPEMWAKDVAGNEMACGDYGGCHFKGICNIKHSSIAELLEHSNVAHLKGGTKGKSTMKLLDIINKGQKTKGVDPEVDAAVEAVGPTSKPEKSALKQAAERAVAARAAPDTRTLAEKQKQDGAKGVNPPPVEEVDLAPELKQATEPVIPQSWKDRLAKGHKPRVDAERAWRELQSKSVQEEAPANVEVKTIAEPPVAEEALEQAATAAVVKAAPDDTFVVLLDCLPIKAVGGFATAKPLGELTRPWKDAICEMKNVPYWNLVPYAEGEKIMAAMAEAAIRENPPKGVFIAARGSTDWKVLGDIVIELADMIITRD